MYKQLILLFFLIRSMMVFAQQDSCMLLHRGETVAMRRQQVMNSLWSSGFLEAEVQLSSFAGDTLCLHLVKGPVYRLQTIRGFSASLLPSLAMDISAGSKPLVLSPATLDQFMQSILQEYDERGFPFASLHLDSIQINKGLVDARLKVSTGPLVRFDTVRISDHELLNKKVLGAMLGLKAGKLFSSKVLDEIPAKINQSGFMEYQNTALSFDGDLAQVLVNVSRRKSSTFFGIVGFTTDENTGKLLLNGDVSMHLLNSFNRAEMMDFRWKAPQAGTQSLEAATDWPFMLAGNFGVAWKFKLFKRDSLFQNVSNKPSLSYNTDINHRISFFADDFRSTDLESYRSIHRLSLGMQALLDKLDNRWNPSRGLLFNAEIAYGNKTVRDTGRVSSSASPHLLLGVEGFIPLFKHSTLLLSNESAANFDGDITVNEKYRIGGYRLLRGYDEESIYSVAYSVTKVEYRLLFQKYSYLAVFANVGLTREERITAATRKYFGMGAGLSFQTTGGTLNFFYALGTPLNFSRSKIHFGYKVRF